MRPASSPPLLCLPACLQKKEIDSEDTWLLGAKKGGKGKGKKGKCSVLGGRCVGAGMGLWMAAGRVPGPQGATPAAAAAAAAALPTARQPRPLPSFISCSLARCACPAEEKKADKAPEKLSHSLDILEAFATLRLEVPLTAEAAGALVGTVAEKKDYFLQR
jgi:hypothetical protein